ncbi:MAG: TIGR02147 family protein [Deltaproteobacteria bacterium]|nr:TIGR02147 family protein [Deltaproteobacteria bacterium]
MTRTSEHVYEHISCKDFLNSLYMSRREKNPAYSMRKFCRDLGFSSPSHLTDIIRGRKNLGPKGAGKIMDQLRMGEQEREYFCFINELDQFSSEGKGKQAADFSGAARFYQIQPCLEDLSAAEWRTCTIIMALAVHYGVDFVAEPLWISRRSRIRLDESLILSCLAILQGRALLGASPADFLFCLPESHGKQQKVQQNYDFRRQLLSEGMELAAASSEQDLFSHETFLLSESDVKVLQQQIEVFRSRLRSWARFRSRKSVGSLGVAVSFQVCPLTSGCKKEERRKSMMRRSVLSVPDSSERNLERVKR